jgi:hypothetical protein
MSFPGSKLKYKHRNYIFNLPFWKKIKEEKKIDLSYKQARQVIDKSQEIIADIIVEEEDGFKLPFGLGYITVTKFISNKLARDWKKSKELGKSVYFTNLNTLGYSVRVIWYSFLYHSNRNYFFREIYMFKTSEYLSKRVSKAFAEGKKYIAWEQGDFVSKGRLEKFYQDKIKNIKDDGSN